ncbi:DUF2126 domain-containing protein [Methylacidimicrobium sp. B4]|uniref:transglutaminase family protein n=1 Tax=Methylacidimicrobium sp. B4 TaxID=2796139 RepID=UPI001A8CF8CE|nr:transglutaminase family protein [Methylacidimicrobium sp. B4]QSR85763.1 transglutaminase family protein [Methylacidimicrobium sp. B4]
MSIHAALTHRTSYRYDRPVMLGPQVIRLRPAPHSRTPILSYSLQVAPKPHFLNWQQDPQGNFLARVIFPERVTHFEVTVDLVADLATINPFDFFLEPQAESWPFSYDETLAEELAPFRIVPEPGPLLAALLGETRSRFGSSPPRTVEMLVAINRALHEQIAYVVRTEPGVYAPEETLALARGSCRDSAWLLVTLLRHLGYAARFVSGYLIQLAADTRPVDGGPAGPEADFTDLHAWAEAYLPGAGWVGLDATSGLLAGEGHLPLAATPSPQSAAPISGSFSAEEGAGSRFTFEMSVRRVSETPRVTKPYTPQQWQEILARGAAIDAALRQADVRLSMGGEPTFVSATDREAAEWSIEALGPTKRTYAGRLLRKLAPLWAPGAALTYSLGKQYPGEPLPRWALHAHWRADGEPVWNDPDLLASDDDADNAAASDAERFAQALAERLGIPPDLIRPAYEDIHYYLWREARLPANLLVEDAKLSDPLERARFARIFSRGLAAPVGSVLPLRRSLGSGRPRWESGRWFFRDDALFLVPGDSPIGLRLPLASLPWADPARMEGHHELDPLAPREPFPPRAAWQPRRSREPQPEGFGPVPQETPVPGREEPGIVRTALCVEPREGRLHVFYPPLSDALDWVELTAAVEETAAAFGRKVVLEGYLPPRDPRLLHFSVTPDPGVIEVNIHPAASWAEMVERTRQLYEAAREVGLSAEKFLLDGRHVGTGGGNHVAMGGPSPAESPFLRRPDLLKSLLGFWHNHPSLSFLFAGLFLGPSSQHPRVDEAREDAVNELEIAFRQVGEPARTPPWLVDRIFRNILCDMTGNTHRTEFCIDKLFAPESASGRQGLVEFRAFEMPPHPEMSSAQMLLLRSAIAAFWKRPYERRLIRWGTRLHDEFLLPHYAEADLRDALEELGSYGFPLNPDWFAPHIAFRFPKLGEVAVRDLQLELRQALEPWHVLGEEPAAGGTARYVDSSLERLQVKVEGWVSERYLLACHGAALPLQRTETQGQYVAGVRYKAWQPYSALHPTIPAHGPLIFDVYDRWNGRSLGGMTYHVVHPGGRANLEIPVNANAAEARRRVRFWPFGHTPGPCPEPQPLPGPEEPRTLDLRRR